MPVNKKQIIRLIKIVAELKQNNYPNSRSLCEKFRRADIEDNLNISCTERTVQRDIEVLKNDFNAPIEFDSSINGYFLADNDWELNCPMMCDGLITSSLLGARIAEGIAPQPLKGMIQDSVEMQLSTNNSDFLDAAFMESLIIASGIKASIEPQVFKTVFDGWRKHEAIRFQYSKPDNSKSDRYFEPHLISFHKGIWYAKGYLLPEVKETVFAIHRMSQVRLSGKYFEPDKSIINKVQKEGLFNYPKIEKIKLLCDKSIGFYLYEHQDMKKFKIQTQENGDLLIELAPAIEHDIIRWVLGEAGKIRVLEPEDLREKILDAGKKIIEANS